MGVRGRGGVQRETEFHPIFHFSCEHTLLPQTGFSLKDFVM
jgi:hypothetical protein